MCSLWCFMWSAVIHISSVLTKISSWKVALWLRPVLSSTAVNEVSEEQSAEYLQLILQQVSVLTQRSLQMFCSHGCTFLHSINIYMCCAYLHIYLSVCMYVCLPSCLSVCPPISPSIHPSHDAMWLLSFLIFWFGQNSTGFHSQQGKR
jgi:hypothetical protein